VPEITYRDNHGVDIYPLAPAYLDPVVALLSRTGLSPVQGHLDPCRQALR
jgi:hypothetical protein